MSLGPKMHSVNEVQNTTSVQASKRDMSHCFQPPHSLHFSTHACALSLSALYKNVI